MSNDQDRRETLRIALWVAIAALVAAVPPVWPYGFYVFLRLGVTVVAISALVVLGVARPVDTIVLAVIALVFNPFIPVHLPKTLWAIVDLAVAAWFWTLIDRRLLDSGTMAE